MTEHVLTKVLASHGLQIMGGFGIEASDNLPLLSGTLVLIGPDEPRFWPIFTAHPLYCDGQPDPLDRWSQAILDPIAADHDGQALYPFGGPPYHPFYTWALRTGRSWASPIGFLVHTRAGLFASYRGALVLPYHLELQAGTKPCDACTDTPCISACPVAAFVDGYDVDACKSHLRGEAGRSCMDEGCAARRACPVGSGNRQPDQAAFHMKAFL